MTGTLTQTRNWTPQQEAFFAAVEGDSHILCTAVAGSGKSTTSVEAIKHVQPGLKPGFCAFNRHIAQELEAKLAGQAKAMTLHSLGKSAVCKAFPDSQLDANKLRNLADDLFAKMNRSLRTEIIDEVRACKQQGLIAEIKNKSPIWIDKDQNEMEVNQEEINAWHLLKSSVEDEDTFDFDDMIYWPYVHNLNVEQFDFLITDESQDMSKLQQFLAKSATRNGRLAVVGDPQQSIYLFSGADSEGIENISSDLRQSTHGLVETPLTVTFRCPRSHVELAQTLVPRIEAAENAIEGTITSEPPFRDFVPGDLIICRKNAPLVNMTYRLLRNNYKARMKGRDIGRGMISLVEKLRADSIEDLVIKSGEAKDRELMILDKRRASESQKQSVLDKYECLDSIIADFDSISQFRDYVNEIFFDDNDSPDPKTIITLSSIHRAKGLEADNVTILEYDGMPLTWAKQLPEEHQQELNIKYVALTRAKRHMNLIPKSK